MSVRLKLDMCVNCSTPIYYDCGTTWVDDTSGDGCEEDVHIPLHDMSVNPYNPRHSSGYGSRLLDVEYAGSRFNPKGHNWFVGKLNELISMNHPKSKKE